MDTPTATLAIIRRPSGSISYRLTDAATGKLVWCTRSLPTHEGRDGARERLRAWLATHPYRVERPARPEAA